MGNRNTKISQDLQGLIPDSLKALNSNKKKIFFTGQELIEKGIDNLPCLLEPIIPKVGLCCVGGSSDTGKSSFLRQLATSIVVGETDFLGYKINAPSKKVIYVATEDDENAIAYLLNKSFQKKGIPADVYSGLKYLFDTQDLLKKLRGILKEEFHDLIIIDAFADLYSGSMQDTNQVRTYLHDFNQLAQEFNCSVIFLHHTGKRTEDQLPSKNNLLGSQGFEAKMRLVIELRNDSFNDSIRHMCIVKGNYLSKDYKNQSFVLEFNSEMEFNATDDRVAFDRLVGKDKVPQIEEVKRLKEAGHTQIEIAEMLGLSQPTVSRNLKS